MLVVVVLVVAAVRQLTNLLVFVRAITTAVAAAMCGARSGRECRAAMDGVAEPEVPALDPPH